MVVNGIHLWCTGERLVNVFYGIFYGALRSVGSLRKNLSEFLVKLQGSGPAKFYSANLCHYLHAARYTVLIYKLSGNETSMLFSRSESRTVLVLVEI